MLDSYLDTEVQRAKRIKLERTIANLDETVKFYTDEAAKARQKLDELVNGNVVRVVFDGRTGPSREYAYEVPEGVEVSVGDQVVVNAFNSYKYEYADKLVTVTNLGRGGYTGQVKRIVGVVKRV